MSPHRQSDAGLVRQIGSTSVPRLLAVDTGSQRGVELCRCQCDVIYAHNHHCARKSIEAVVSMVCVASAKLVVDETAKSLSNACRPALVGTAVKSSMVPLSAL
jgi:hypothetical protein